MTAYTNKTILRDLGLLLHVPGVMVPVLLPVCFVFGEYYAIWSFLGIAFCSFGIGQLLYRLFHQAQEASKCAMS